MGSVSSTLDANNNMINLIPNLQNKSAVVPQSILSQYISYVNSAGVIIASINITNLTNYLQNLGTQYNPSNTQVGGNVGLGAMMVLSMGSLTGLFTLQSSTQNSGTVNIVIPKILSCSDAIICPSNKVLLEYVLLCESADNKLFIVMFL
jgi:hypothetical protein